MFCSCRMHKDLASIEKKHNFTRWQQNDPKFLQLINVLNTSQKQHTLLQLHQQASERGFLISLLSKYSGWCQRCGCLNKTGLLYTVDFKFQCLQQMSNMFLLLAFVRWSGCRYSFVKANKTHNNRT